MKKLTIVLFSMFLMNTTSFADLQLDDKYTTWHENGQKQLERNYTIKE